MRGPSRGQEGHAVRGPGAAPAGGARLLRRIPRGGRGRHSQPARPRQPVPERRLPSGDRLPGHAIFAFLRAPTGMQWLRGAVHPHAERAIPVGAHVSERGRVAAWAGGISPALQSALDRPALGLPHASPGSPAASCTWSRCMNTLSSVSKKSGAKQPFLLSRLQFFEPRVLFGHFQIYIYSHDFSFPPFWFASTRAKRCISSSRREKMYFESFESSMILFSIRYLFRL